MIIEYKIEIDTEMISNVEFEQSMSWDKLTIFQSLAPPIIIHGQEALRIFQLLEPLLKEDK
jgi:hypothetical protein